MLNEVMVDVELAGNAVLELRRAVLVYADSAGAAFATVHDVLTDAQGQPVLGAGAAMTPEMAASICQGVLRQYAPSYLPEQVLFQSPTGIVWWMPPQRRHVFMRATRDDRLAAKGEKVPHPGLVFYAGTRGWFVFAVKGGRRPTPDTELYQAPYFNVYGSGSICAGNVSLPGCYTVDAIQEYEKCWFESAFTHPNHTPLTRYPKGDSTLWVDLLAGKFKRFPERYLIRKATLGGLIRAVTPKGIDDE